MNSALLFASTYRSIRTPKLPRDVVGLTQTTRAGTVQSVYMSRLAEGKSAHMQYVEGEEEKNDVEIKKNEQYDEEEIKRKSQLEIEIEEHSRNVEEMDEKSMSAERAIRLVSKRK